MEHLLRHAGSLPTEVLRLGPGVDRRIASIALAALGIRTEDAPSTPTFVPDWRVTRYADTAGATPAPTNRKRHA